MLIANALEMFVVLFTANFAIYNADFYQTCYVDSVSPTRPF